MRKYIFWITVPVTFVGFALLVTLELLAQAGQNLCHNWEDFCFGYSKNGYKLSKNGNLWVKHFEKE